MDDTRFQEIDIRVEESGHRYNPNTERFEATVGSDADNNLDYDFQSFRSMLSDVDLDELRAYMSRKAKEADDEFYQHEADRMFEELEGEKPSANEGVD
jgi:hypothetical protein